jgi:N-acylglucosamine 2-epimerase
MTSVLRDLRARFEAELFQNIIPFWMDHSIDTDFGGFWTCLDRQGRVYDARKYVWMNGRQVWTLSKLYREAGARQEWLDAARLGAEFLRDHVFLTDGDRDRCWFSLTREGAPAGYQRKPYGVGFVALGFHEYGLASGDDTFLTRAQQVFAAVRRFIADPAILGRPAFSALAPSSQLADIYIVLALALEMGDREAVRQMLDKIDIHYDAERRVYLESAVIEPAQRFDFPEGRLVCVGSNFEIAWLLLDALDWFPNDQLREQVLSALEGALEFGWDRHHGGFFYFQDIQGHPTLQLEWAMKLWWVHVEAIYALVRAYQATRDPKWLAWLERVVEYVFARFPDREHGEWFGYLNQDGQPGLTLKGNHYKGCFHIPRALWFSIRAIRQMETEPDAVGR